MLATSAWGWWSVESALRWAAGALVAALVGIGFLAVRRISLSWQVRLLVLGGEAVLALAVIGLEMLAHG
jgi:hypothetical protein